MNWLHLMLSLVVAATPPPGPAESPSTPAFSTEVEPFISSRGPVIVLENVRIIDGTGAPPRERQTIVIADGRIAAVGPMGQVRMPATAERRQLAGRTVMPGLVMLHEHMMYFSGRRVWHSQPVSYPRLYLAAGVTTARTAGGDFPYIDLNLASRIRTGRIAGPRLFVTGPNLNGPDDPFIGDVIVRDPGEARREVDYWAARGITSFKIYTGLDPDSAAAVIARAHALGLVVTGHLGRTTCTQAAEFGIDNIEHSFLACLSELGLAIGEDGRLTGAIDPERADRLIALLVRRGVVLTSTPVSLDAPDAEIRALLHPTALANWENGQGRPPAAFLDVEPHIRGLERQFLAAGGRLVIGADAENYGRIAGFANHRALELLVEAGHAPLAVIRMATMDGARFLGIDGDTGSIAVGKAADLIVVAGDPSARIGDVRRVEEVFRAGIGYDPIRLKASVRGVVGWH